MNIKWDANKYTSDFSFVHQYGNSVMELIDADVNNTVLDLGCGNGALTKSLQEKITLLLNLYKEMQLTLLFLSQSMLFFLMQYSIGSTKSSNKICSNIDNAVEVLRSDLYMDSKWYADYVRIRMKAIRL